MEIAIIGGGASGLAAAIAARQTDQAAAVTLYERQTRVGRKLLATGNGRCNLTNRAAGIERYHGLDATFARPALQRFGPEETLSWFAWLGLACREEADGRVYPLSDTAGSVVDALRLGAEALGVTLRCGVCIASASRKNGRFRLTDGAGATYACDRLVVACGGAAGARLGGVRCGYDLLRGFGHDTTALFPSLVQLKTDNTWTRPLKGVRTAARITLLRGGATVAESSGEVQFTDYGLTGPGAFDISRAAAMVGTGCTVSLRLLPAFPESEILRYMQLKRDHFRSLRAENLLTGLVHGALARTVLRRAHIAPDTPLERLTAADCDRVRQTLCRYDLPLAGTLGFDDAQVTAGGVRTADFDPRTLESRHVPGLYACGEVLDIDGDCGGYNLQWAWASGRAAGIAAVGAG